LAIEAETVSRRIRLLNQFVLTVRAEGLLYTA
jgi:hypothetical protein